MLIFPVCIRSGACRACSRGKLDHRRRALFLQRPSLWTGSLPSGKSLQLARCSSFRCASDRKLAERVVEVSWITGAALCFYNGRLFGLVAFLLEKVFSLLDAHLSGVHLDADDEARVAQ